MATSAVRETKGLRRLIQGQCPLHGVPLVTLYVYKATLRGGYTALRCPATDCGVKAKMSGSTIELFRECSDLLNELE